MATSSHHAVHPAPSALSFPGPEPCTGDLGDGVEFSKHSHFFLPTPTLFKEGSSNWVYKLI